LHYEVRKVDKRVIVTAASKAQLAADYLVKSSERSVGWRRDYLRAYRAVSVCDEDAKAARASAAGAV